MIINENIFFNSFLGKNKNRKIFIGIDNTLNADQYNKFLQLFSSLTYKIIFYNDNKSLEKEMNNFNDIIYVLLIKNNIAIKYIKNDSRIFIFKLFNMPLPSIKIFNIANSIHFNIEIKNYTLLSSYLQYTILNPTLYVNISKLHGFGLYSSKRILKNEYIFSLNGKIVNKDYINNKNFTGEWNALKNNMYLIRKNRTSYGFINHSRTPNCKIDINTMDIIAIVNINENTELLLDYREEPLSEEYINMFGKTYL